MSDLTGETNYPERASVPVCPCHKAPLMYSHYFETKDGVKIGVYCCKYGGDYLDFGQPRDDDNAAAMVAA